ncbi:MAG TPA: ACP phosphodiesterase [Chitinophagaceae bacterium]
MNYLAHAWLSFLDPEIMVGNLISDFVKGKKKFGYPAGIQKGILLHRILDTYTDNHPATREAREIFRPHYRLYCGAFIDVVYDHFLATDDNEFNDQSLLDFTSTAYSFLANHSTWLPERFAGMFPYMRSQNWLYHYRQKKGIERSMEGLVRRSAYMQESATAYQLFEEHYQRLGVYYRQFWADMRPFALQQFEILKLT